jgi:membrane associated rhomboid family serine protease
MTDDSVLSNVQTAFRAYATSEATVTYIVISLIAVVFLSEVLMTALTSLGSIQVFATGMFGVYPTVAWPLSPVLHRGFRHFAASVFGLLVVGVPVEQHWSRTRYMAFLILTGYATIAAGAGVLWVVADQPVAFYGTSGVIYALAGYSLTHLPRQHTPRSAIEAVAVLVGASALLSVLFDVFTGPYFTAQWMNGGHISGFVIGAVVGWSDLSRCTR